MDLLFLCKRRPMGRDMIVDPYGRFYYLPKLLAERGHQVRVLLLDYKNGDPVDETKNGIHWLSASMGGYIRTLRQQIAGESPDWLIGFSDTYFGILAAHFGRKYAIRSCIDAYDNYESYIGWLKPLHWIWRNALSTADLVTAAGPALVDLMSLKRHNRASAVVPMAADPTGFGPRDKLECRRELGLDPESRLVGYCGSMHRSRGVDVFFEAIEQMHELNPEVRFIHSGRTWKDVPLPGTLRSLGFIDEKMIPVLLNSMDTLVVVNRPSAFGHYSHPVKLYEAMTCQVPVVATRTQATEWILRSHLDRLVPPDDANALRSTIVASLDSPPPDYHPVPSWPQSCDVFEQALRANLA